VFEYTDDLATYYESGYGSSINWEISCPLLQDMFTQFDLVVANTSDFYELAKLRFAHAETILPFVALLVYYTAL
jgi:hypothetical protein